MVFLGAALGCDCAFFGFCPFGGIVATRCSGGGRVYTHDDDAPQASGPEAEPTPDFLSDQSLDRVFIGLLLPLLAS